MLKQILEKVLTPLPLSAQSVASAIFISVVPIFFVYAINTAISGVGGHGAKDMLIKYGMSLAIGGLLGEVFFHTLPQLK